VVVRTTVGSRWPLHATGVGLVLLAFAEPAVQERIFAAPLARFTPYTITDPARLRAKLAEVRRADAAVSDRQITDDAISVAAPIRDAAGSVVAALSLVVPASTNPAALVPAVRMAARGSSRALGYLGASASPASTE
jgi:DNA-binding IclR family transcriptional regulator